MNLFLRCFRFYPPKIRLQYQKYGYNPKNICKEPIKEASCRAQASHRVSTALCEGKKKEKKKTRYENNHDSLGI